MVNPAKTLQNDIFRHQIDRKQPTRFVKSIKPIARGFTSIKPAGKGLDIDSTDVQIKVDLLNLELKTTKKELEIQMNLYNYESETFIFENYIEVQIIINIV